jgi:hypothetical protein
MGRVNRPLFNLNLLINQQQQFINVSVALNKQNYLIIIYHFIAIIIAPLLKTNLYYATPPTTLHSGRGLCLLIKPHHQAASQPGGEDEFFNFK